MAKNEKTGNSAAKSASKVLRGLGSKSDAKSSAGSALSQAPDKRGPSAAKKKK
jgi:hypothetical protein